MSAYGSLIINLTLCGSCLIVLSYLYDSNSTSFPGVSFFFSLSNSSGLVVLKHLQPRHEQNICTKIAYLFDGQAEQSLLVQRLQIFGGKGGIKPLHVGFVSIPNRKSGLTLLK